jgi:hypothetical protein
MTDPDILCTGLNPPREGAIKLKFSTYADLAALPKIPNNFGHEEYVPAIQWGLWGNDKFGDCVVVGGCNEEVIWNRMAGKIITFNTKDVLADFTAITGLPPSPFVGADMQQAAQYRQKVGLLGADGQRHRIAAYVALEGGNLRELYAAMYLFGAVGIGIQFPSTAFDQFRRHQAWAIVSKMHFDGSGHYVPCVALRSNIVAVTWGRFQAMRPSFYASLCNQAVAYISQEALVNQKSPEGFDYQQLEADLQAIAAGG